MCFQFFKCNHIHMNGKRELSDKKCTQNIFPSTLNAKLICMYVYMYFLLRNSTFISVMADLSTDKCPSDVCGQFTRVQVKDQSQANSLHGQIHSFWGVQSNHT